MDQREPDTAHLGTNEPHVQPWSRPNLDCKCGRFETDGISHKLLPGYGLESGSVQFKNLLSHTEKWCAAQFGEKYSKEAARTIDTYTKYSRRITPELAERYHLQPEKDYNEFETVMNDFRALAADAFRLYQQNSGREQRCF